MKNIEDDKIKDILNKIKINKIQKEEKVKPRSYTFDSRKPAPNNNPIKINLRNINFIGNNTMRNYINLLGNNENVNEDRKNIFLNTNKLPKIINRISLSNSNKKEINNQIGFEDNNMIIQNKLSIFNKTFGNRGFNGIIFNKGISAMRNTNYKISNNSNINNGKLLDPYKEILKYKISKEQLVNPNYTNYTNIINNLHNLNFNCTNKINNKEKIRFKINKNSFNSKATTHNNKCYNNSNINQINIFKINNKEKEKLNIKENEEKNDFHEENNDSFINEFKDLFSNVKGNNDSQEYFQENIIDENKLNESDDDDKEPDPRINFEQINRVNKSRPQTSYGGLNARRKNLQSAMRNRKNRPTTSNVPD